MTPFGLRKKAKKGALELVRGLKSAVGEPASQTAKDRLKKDPSRTRGKKSEG